MRGSVSVSESGRVSVSTSVSEGECGREWE